MKHLLSLLLLLSIGSIGKAEVSYAETMKDRATANPLIQISYFSFSSMAQGNFENGEFSEDVNKTMREIEGDVKRKFNNRFKEQGYFNITDFEKGISKHYAAIDTVYCEIRDACQPTIRGLNDCYIADCTLKTLYDTNIREAEAENKVLSAIHLFCAFSAYGRLEHVSFTGPFPVKATIEIDLFGVPPFEMESDDIQTFENAVTDILSEMPQQTNSGLQIRPVTLRSHSVLNDTKPILSGSMNSSSSSLPEILSKLHTVLHIYSIHELLPSQQFDDQYVSYLHSHRNDLIKKLKDSGHEYFSKIDGRSSFDSSVNGPDKHLKSTGESKIDGVLLLRIFGIFLLITVPVIAFIRLRNEIKRR